MFGSGARIVLATLGGVLASIATISVLASGGSTMSLPNAGAVPISGLRLEADWRWVDGVGYRPIRVTLSTASGQPVTADRNVRVEIVFRNFRRAATVSEYLEIGEGNSSVTRTILAPPGHSAQMVDVSVFENGRKIRELSAAVGAGFRNNPNEDHVPKLLILDRDAPTVGDRMTFANSASQRHDLPDLRHLLHMLSGGGGPIGGEGNDSLTVQLVNGTEYCELLPLQSAPADWLEYSSIDVAFISWDDLVRLKAEHPDRWSSLRQWTTAGGTLGVFAIDESPASRRDLDALLERSAGGAVASEPAATGGDWRPPDRNHWTPGTRSLQPFFRTNMNGGAVVVPQGAVVDETMKEEPSGKRAVGSKSKKAAELPAFQIRSLQFGRVVAMSDRDPFALRGDYWECLFKSLDGDRWSWNQRHGLSLSEDNHGFWNFLIPGVGRAPIGGFLLLTTLFMIAVGPVNYYLLRRRGKLVLQLITIPAAAIVVTSGLLCYAMVSDGLHVRARVRSLTSIDQREKRLVAWSRQAYYAGLTPSSGLRYPRDTAVYPLEASPPSNYEATAPRTTDWRQQQNLVGYLAARTPTQFVAVRSCETTAELVVKPGADNGAAATGAAATGAAEGAGPSVENRLGARAAWLLLCDAGGDLFWGDAIDPKAVQRLKPISADDARKKLTTLFRDHRPAFPEGIGADEFEVTFRNQSRRRYWGGPRSPIPPSTATSLLEQQIRIWSELSPAPAARSYLAQLDQPPAALLGTEAREEASLHLVEGKW